MDRDYRRAANITVIAAGLAIAGWLFFKYALGGVMPFLLAALIGALVSPLAAGLAKKTGLPKKIWAAVLVILLFAALSALLFLFCARLMDEIGNLLARLEADPTLLSDALGSFGGYLADFGKRFGFLRKLFESEAWLSLGVDIDALLKEALGSLLASLTGALPVMALGVVKKLPGAILFAAVLLISAFYFAADDGSIGQGLSSLLPEKWQAKLPTLKARLKSTLAGFCKAYLLIFLLTFCQLFIGFTVLRVHYAFLLALLVALVDILPILGTGTVLVPWGLFALFTGNAPLGIGLLILYGVTLILRQLLEPKIVGESLGLHPLATLASIYFGLKFLGLGGLLVGPMTAAVIKGFLGRQENEAGGRS